MKVFGEKPLPLPLCTRQISPRVREVNTKLCYLNFRHRASSIYDRRFAAIQRTLFIYLINKCISLSDICLTVHQ